MAHSSRKLAAAAALILPVLWGSQGPRRPFSHKYHLTQVAACESCHTSADTSTKASDDLMPHSSACVTCHDEVHIKEVRKTGVASFNHQQHLKLGKFGGKTACEGCHTGIAEAENMTGKHYPAMASCVVCHPQSKMPDGCKQCHAPGFTLKPADHTPKFADDHSAPNNKIAKTGCAVCHGKKFTCQGCH